MKTKLLYPLLLVGVLMIAGCFDEETQRNAGEPRPPAAASDSDAPDPAFPGPAPSESQAALYRVVFLGDSITAGYGIDPDDAFPALIQRRIDENGYPFQVIDAGTSGDTSAGGLTRIGWLLRSPIDVLVLELGGNDGLRGIELSATRTNLSEIVERTLAAYPECRIVVAGMMVPPNLGHEYTASFRDMYPEIASRFDATLIPFILEGVGGVPEMMQSDGIHPTTEGHAIVAQTVWDYLEPELVSVSRATGSP